jgi:hypothetical protein
MDVILYRHTKITASSWRYVVRAVEVVRISIRLA